MRSPWRCWKNIRYAPETAKGYDPYNAASVAQAASIVWRRKPKRD